MMIIKDEEHYFFIPNSGLNIICEREYKHDLINDLYSYFNQKKKNKCVVLDDDNNVISNKDVEFIYISYNENLDGIFDFKLKTMLNNELSLFIESNNEMFTSIERIRLDIYELLSDTGMFKFIQILENGLDIKIGLTPLNFTLSKILQTLQIECSSLNKIQQLLILYNLLLYLNRNSFNIIYLDFPINDYCIKWLNSIDKNNNTILISNDSVESIDELSIDGMVVLANINNVSNIEINNDEIRDYSYALNSTIAKFSEYQNEKILRIMNQFDYRDTSFFIRFVDLNSI